MVYPPPPKPVANPAVLEYLRRDNCNKAEAYRVYIEIFDEHVTWKALHRYLKESCGYSWVPAYTYFTGWMNAVVISAAEIRDVVSRNQNNLVR